MPEIPGRDEEILQSIINGTSYTVIPQSRIEVLLLQLKDVIENGSQPGAFVIKGRVDTYEDLLLVSNPEPGWVYFVGYSTDTEFKEYVYTDQNVWQFVGYNSITVDSALSTTSENPVQNKVVTNAINGKQATLTSPQLNAVNSGIDSTKVSQIETNKNDITNLKNAPSFYVDNSGYISVDYGNE